MSSGPSISVVIPTFDRAEFIAEAIDSVLGQTMAPAEIIVVDDGSTDATAEILGRYGATVQAVYQPNQGAAAARNRGMRLARGDWIAFLDSDDLWRPHRLESQAAACARHPELEFVFADCECTREGNCLVPSYTHRFPGLLHELARAVPVADLFGILLRANVIATPTVLLKRECLERVGLFDPSLPSSEDRDYWLRLSRACCCGYVDEVLVECRVHNTNLGADRILNLDCRLRVMTRWLQAVEPPLTAVHLACVRQAVSMTHAKLARQCLRRGRAMGALRHLGAAAGTRWARSAPGRQREESTDDTAP